MTEHRIHVTSWHFQAHMELRCLAGLEAPCHSITDEWGNNPQPVDYCNAVDWWGNVDPEDIIHGQLQGEPPWNVEVTWTDDGPEIRQA